MPSSRYLSFAAVPRGAVCRAAVAFLPALAAFAFTGLALAQEGQAKVTLRSPTGSGNASPVGSTVKLTGSSTSAGSLAIERLRAPYDGDWKQVKTLPVTAGAKFSLNTREPVNTRYRAILAPGDGGGEQTSNTVGAWRKQPKARYATRPFAGGFSTRVTISLPSAAVPGGVDAFGLGKRKVVFYSRFTRPSDLRRSYWLRRGTVSTKLVGRKLSFSYDIKTSVRIPWRALGWWCYGSEGGDPFGSPRAIQSRCPTRRKLPIRETRKLDAIADRG